MDGRCGWRGGVGAHTVGPQPSITVHCLTHQTPVVELLLPLFIPTGGLDEAELFILAGLIIHALSHHTATGKQKQRHRRAGVQVASRTRQNLDSFFDSGVSGGHATLMALLPPTESQPGRACVC